MLTKQHTFATKISNPVVKENYRLHMCGLCSALGEKYGQVSRLFTNHELTLLNILISAQSEDSPQLRNTFCPINPLKKVTAIADRLHGFSADAAVILGKNEIDDRRMDSKFFDLSGWFISHWISKAYRMSLDCARLFL